MKNKILKYIVTIILFLITIFAINEVQAKSYTIEDMDIQATILENGSVKVEQELTYKFNGSYNGIYIDIPDSVDNEEYDKFREQTTALRDSLYNASSVQITNVSEISGTVETNYNKVSSASNGRNGVYTIQTENGLKRIKVYSPSTNTKKTFKINFVLKNLCVKHNDIGELYYNFIGGGWQTKIKNLNIDIYLPSNTNKEALKIFAHGPYEGQSKIISNEQVNLKVSNVKPGEYVAARVIFDNNNIISSTKNSNINALSIIMQDEQNIFDNKQEKDNFTKKVLVFAGILLLYWIILLLIFEKDKKYQVINTNEDEMMEKYNPLLAGCIKESRTILARDIIAVLMNLISKKVIKLTLMPKIKGKDDYIYQLNKIHENEAQMDEIERYVYNWFFEDKESRSLVDRLKKIPKEKGSNKKLEELNNMAQKQLQSLGANKEMPEGIKIFNALLLGLCIAIILIHINFNGFSIYSMSGIASVILPIIVYGFIVLPLFMTLLYIPLKILAVLRHGVNKLTKRLSGKRIVSTTIVISLIFAVLILVTNYFVPGSYIIADEILLGVALIIVLTDNLMLKNSSIMIEDFSRINAFSEKLENTLLSERDVEEVILWEHYFAYAVAFGTAKKVAARIKDMPLDDDLMKLVSNREFEEYLINDYYDFYRYSEVSHVFLENYKASMGKVWQAYASGGGSSSGGGGGFFGGGGFSGGGGRGGGGGAF